MDIKLRNFGKIKEADIQLSGLTLIAGPNDSGKPTVGKALFAIIKSIANYPDYFNQVNSEKLYREYLKPLRLELREIDRLIMLDEPETHFNEHWKRYFLKLLCDVLAKKNADVFVATHSAMLVNKSN